MNKSNVLFWNVDTQVDFVEPHGKLYVPGAELLKQNWKILTDYAEKNNLVVVNTCDWHYPGSGELSQNPDFINTFPPHCMANTVGAEFIESTTPENPEVVDWSVTLEKESIQLKSRNILIRKDAFDVFKGNPNTEQILNMLAPKKVIVYGVTTNVCVNDAVQGLAKRVEEVLVIEDAIKELPNIPLPFEHWKKLGVKLIRLHELENYL